jgi:hypothetical protein
MKLGQNREKILGAETVAGKIAAERHNLPLLGSNIFGGKIQCGHGMQTQRADANHEKGES